MSKLFILQPNDYNDRVKGKKKDGKSENILLYLTYNFS